jgi:hypothetical protein
VSRRLTGKKAAFWVAVGGVALLANFVVELAADKVPVPGLARFVSYIHRGPGTGGS